jgi:hypothetical protein
MACSNNNFGCTRGYYCEYADICPRLNEKLKKKFKEEKAIFNRLDGEDCVLYLEQNAIKRQKFLADYSVKNECPFYKKNV